jgi:hypothetical protein
LRFGNFLPKVERMALLIYLRQEVYRVDIFEKMDCTGCENLKHIRGRAWGDPDRCYPPEDVCVKGCPEKGPCERMLSVINSLALDGALVTERGYLADSEWLETAGEELDHHLAGVDFSGAPYWWIPYTADENGPRPYKDEAAIYEEWFR